MSKGVFSIIDDLSSQLGELKRALEPLAGLVSSSRAPSDSSRRRGPGLPRSTGGSVRPHAAASKRMPIKKKRATSPKLRAMRKQQGQYLGALRQLTPAQRQQVKKAKATGDYASALKVAAGLAKKSAMSRKGAGKRRKRAVAQPVRSS